jgi:PAS domain S-box-containing protein
VSIDRFYLPKITGFDAAHTKKQIFRKIFRECMTIDNDPPSNMDKSEIRRQAEEKIRRKMTKTSTDLQSMSPEDIHRLVFELQVYQAELEIQNEELRRSEEALNKTRTCYYDLYNQAPVGYVTLTREGLIREANATAAALLEVDKRDLAEQPITRFILPVDQDIFYYHRRKLLETGMPLVSELRMLKKAGASFWSELTSTLVKGQDDSPVWRIVLSDISERKQMEEANAQLKAQLNQAQKMEAIGTLAGGIAHDFNNILGAILGYAELAREDSPSESTVAHDLDQIIMAASRARDLVIQILAFSRQSETESVSLQPAHIVREILKMLRSILPTGIDIRQDIDDQTDLIVADPTHIHQIVMNLCTNAFHAMEASGGTLFISLHKTVLGKEDLVDIPNVQPGNFMQLSIRDTGPGIPPEIQDKIFDPYFTTKETGKGTGMGLAITHGIVQSYGGFIRLHSTPGEGSVFHIFLPTVTEQALRKQDSIELPSAGSEHILFVDDEKMLVRMAETMLQRLGYRVTARTSSLEALTTFQNQPDAFDLVITDYSMPGMAGIDLARRMLQIRPQLPIILCTGFSSTITEEKARIAGIKGFAMKPVAMKELAALIRKVLDKK